METSFTRSEKHYDLRAIMKGVTWVRRQKMNHNRYVPERWHELPRAPNWSNYRQPKTETNRQPRRAAQGDTYWREKFRSYVGSSVPQLLTLPGLCTRAGLDQIHSGYYFITEYRDVLFQYLEPLLKIFG